MTRWIIFLMFLSTQAMVSGETPESSTDILEYVEQFLAHSVGLQQAIDGAEQAREAYENAKIHQESAYNISLLEHEYRFRQAEVLATENLEIIEVFQRVFNDLAAEKAFDQAKAAEHIKAEEYARADELSKRDYISLAEKNTAHIAYLQASSEVRAAMNSYRGAQKALILWFLRYSVT